MRRHDRGPLRRNDQRHHARQHAVHGAEDRAGIVGARDAGCQHGAGRHILDRDRRHAPGNESADQDALARQPVVEDAQRACARQLVPGEVDHDVRLVTIGKLRKIEPGGREPFGQPRGAVAIDQPFQLEQQLDRGRERARRAAAQQAHPRARLAQALRQFAMNPTQARRIEAECHAYLAGLFNEPNPASGRPIAQDWPLDPTLPFQGRVG